MPVVTSLDSDCLKAALALRMSEDFGERNFMNALFGEASPAWDAVRTFRAQDLVLEATRRGIDVENLATAYKPGRIGDSRVYRDIEKDLYSRA